MKKILKFLVLMLIVVGIATIVVVFVHSKSHTYSIPKSIKNQLAFPVLFLTNPTAGYKLDTTSIKYSPQPDGSKVFSFIAYSPVTRITISEQAYPEVLIYDKLTNSVNPYSEVGSLYGKVTLGKPKDSGGRQTAVLKYTDSTLIFAQPTNALSDSDWRILFNSLDTVK